HQEIEVLDIQSENPAIQRRAVKLDHRWRNALQSLPVADNMNEYILQKFVALNARLFFENKYPFIYGWELPLDPRNTSQGSCDLVLWDGDRAVIVVEIKYFNSNSGKQACTKRNQKRNKVRDQATQNARIFANLHPEMNVEYTSITNEDLRTGPYRELRVQYEKFAAVAWKNWSSSYQ
ncbi:MAG TPA: hypothetical protein VKK79_16140, partial [Candidatus Lokiarchaeia archaeon]|nr:hypothetical protein [Candidatus Lokiarchaeia archaeon]